MPHKDEPRGCDGTPSDKEQLVAAQGYTTDERAVLAIARHYFLTFAEPGSHAWMRAQMLACCSFDAIHGLLIADAVLGCVREMRLARGSSFRFSNPDCPGCARILCECERQLMSLVIAIRHGRPSAAHVNAMMLCEGNDAEGLMEAVESLVEALNAAAPVDRPFRGEPVGTL